VYSPGFYRTKIFAEMTICWQVPYGSTAVFMVLRYYGSTVTSTVLVPWKKKYRGSTVVPWYRPTLPASDKFQAILQSCYDSGQVVHSAFFDVEQISIQHTGTHNVTTKSTSVRTV